MSQRLTIDKIKNPDAAKFLSDKEPGAAVRVETTLVAQDDQTATLELESVDEGTPSDDAATPEPDGPSEQNDSAAMALVKGKA